MNKLIIDTSAWIEYFNGTDKGIRVREAIADKHLFVTGMIVTELCAKFIRDQKPIDVLLNALRSMTILLSIDYELARQSAYIYNQQRKVHSKFGILDAHVAAAARVHKSRVVTCDYDFSGLPEVILIK